MRNSLRHRYGRPAFFVVLATVMLGACGSDDSDAEARSEGPVRIEIISLDHAPIRPTTAEAEDVAAEFGDNVTVSTYYFDTSEGDEFAAENGLTDHTPIAVFIDGESNFDIDGRSVNFLNFPVGEGTGVVADGDWSIDDLRTIVDRVVSEQQGG